MKTSTKLLLTGLTPVFVLLLIVVTVTLLAVGAKAESRVENTEHRDTVRIETIKTVHDTVWLPSKCNRTHIAPKPILVDSPVHTAPEIVNP